jgi:hypothetical protein
MPRPPPLVSFPPFNSPAHNSLSLPPLSLPRGALGFGDADRRNLDPRGEPPLLSLSLSLSLPSSSSSPHPTRPPLAARPRAPSGAPRAASWPRPLRPPLSRPTLPPGRASRRILDRALPGRALARPWPRPVRHLGLMPWQPSCPGGLAPRVPARLVCPHRAQRVRARDCDARCSTFSLIRVSLF